MTLGPTFRRGSLAAEDLASALLGIDIAKAIDPLTDAGFLQIAKAIARRLARAAAGSEGDVVADAIGKLDLDWAKLSPQATAAAMRAIDQAVQESYEKRVIKQLVNILVDEGPKVAKSTKASMAKKIKASKSLTVRDTKAVNAIRNSHVNFIRDSTGQRLTELSQKARTRVANMVYKNRSTPEIAESLKTLFKKSVPRPESYWDVVAEAFTARGRTTSQIYALDEAGYVTYTLVAVLDEVTTDICRHLDGKTFLVSRAKALIESLNELEDPEGVKYAAPWVRVGKGDDGGKRLYVPRADGSRVTVAKIVRSGVGTKDDLGSYADALSDEELEALGVLVPPFHGRCRTTLVAGPA